MEDDFSALDGLSLPEAFRIFVLQHPSVLAIAKDVLRQHPNYRQVFEEGQTPGIYVDYRWPLKIEPSELAFRFVSKPIYWLDAPLPEAPQIVEQAAVILCDRLERLRALLIEGRLLATGTFVRTGTITPIDSLQWARETIEIDVKNGDLVELVKYKPVVLWSGIRFSAARQMKNKSKASSRVETTGVAKHECTEWLVGLMLESPDIRPQPKSYWWKLAQSKWENRLSRRGFDAAWAEAINRTKAAAWGAAGAPRKSLQGQ